MGWGVTNRWQIAVEPVLPILIDIIDIADTAADLFNTLITNAIDSLISGLPSGRRISSTRSSGESMT